MRVLLYPIAALFFLAFWMHPEHACARPHSKRPVPTKANVKYGTHKRNTLDFWQAKASSPTPLLIYFHGGGFKAGDKSDIHRNIVINDYLSKGVSCISVNYPFLKHKKNDYLAIMGDCEKVVQFILSNSKAWNIDKTKIASSGISAGALITEWIGYKTDAVNVMGVMLQPKGTLLLAAAHVKPNSPPLFIYQSSSQNDQIHHPKYAKMLKAACDKKGVTCELWGTGKNGIDKLPADRNPKAAMMQFFFKTWKED